MVRRSTGIVNPGKTFCVGGTIMPPSPNHNV
jgi:hypothetical protein